MAAHDGDDVGGRAAVGPRRGCVRFDGRGRYGRGYIPPRFRQLSIKSRLSGRKALEKQAKPYYDSIRCFGAKCNCGSCPGKGEPAKGLSTKHENSGHQRRQFLPQVSAHRHGRRGGRGQRAVRAHRNRRPVHPQDGRRPGGDEGSRHAGSHRPPSNR